MSLVPGTSWPGSRSSLIRRPTGGARGSGWARSGRASARRRARRGAAWADAGVIVPWTLYTMYGDQGIVQRHFASMTAWMDYLERVNPDYLRTRGLGASYNDWLAPGADDTPEELLATAYWAHDAGLMAEMAEAIGRTDEAARYRGLRAKIGSAFAEAFVSGDGRITSGTQTAYVLGLHMRHTLAPASGRRLRTPGGDPPDGLASDHGLRRCRGDPCVPPGRHGGQPDAGARRLYAERGRPA